MLINFIGEPSDGQAAGSEREINGRESLRWVVSSTEGARHCFSNHSARGILLRRVDVVRLDGLIPLSGGVDVSAVR